MSDVIDFTAAKIKRLRDEAKRRREEGAKAGEKTTGDQKYAADVSRLAGDLRGAFGGDEPGRTASASGERAMWPRVPRKGKGSRDRCSCCGNQATHIGGNNGVGLTSGCEWYVRTWVRDPNEARAMTRRFRDERAEEGACGLCGSLVRVPARKPSEAGHIIRQKVFVRLTGHEDGDVIERTRRGASKVFLHHVCCRPG